MFKNPSFLFDIICTAAWIILVVRYARKGFLSSIVQPVSYTHLTLPTIYSV